MAVTEVLRSPDPEDRHSRRRPFSHWMKRLANLKHSSSPNHTTSSKQATTDIPTKSKKGSRNNNPYPLSGFANRSPSAHANGRSSISEPASSIRRSHLSQSEPYFTEPIHDSQPQAAGSKSTAPTFSTSGDTAMSDTGYSKAGTTATAGAGISFHGGGEGSTFSSPAPSLRSLTTTLTTVQSTAPSNHIYAAQNINNYYSAGIGGNPNSNNLQPGHQFSHQFPTSPITAVPSHLIPQPTTYTSATANNLLTDNASVLTLASSSKRRRRNSLDTNASVRALAPSSLFSGSRESLPLSVLSGSGATAADPSSLSAHNAAGVASRIGPASIHSTSGVAATDRGSVRSGFQSHHGRNDSITGSIGAQVSGSLPGGTGRVSRRGSGWGEIVDSDDTGDETPREEELEMDGDLGSRTKVHDKAGS
ncbi:hypothetical protein FQN57_000334 [Myotisia sp. PD_48]|nr:hypothetical protein FQN57_000334 [Myotisia sp. PD_48]